MKAVMVAAVLLTLCGAMPTKAQTPGPFPFTGNDLMPACEAADYMNITRSYLNLSKEMIAQAGVCMGQMDATCISTKPWRSPPVISPAYR